MRKKWRYKEIKQVQGEKKEKGNRRKILNLKPIFNPLILFLFLALILNPLILKPVLAAPSKGYEKLEYEKIFEKKDPDGRMYSEWNPRDLNSENDYYENIIDKKIYKPDGTPMKEEYLPIAKFKVEVYRDGKISGNNVEGGALIFEGETSSDIVKHIGEFQIGDIIKIIDISEARVGTLGVASFNGIVRRPGYDYNMPNGFGGELNLGGSKALELTDKGSHRIALQVKLKERAYSEKDKSHYDIWSANGAVHAWGKSYYGEANVPWEGWSHFTGVTFDVKEKRENDIGMYKNIRLINNNNEVLNTYRKGEPLRLIFPVEHVKGNSIIGTDPVKNPKVIINVVVRDKDNKVIHEEKIQTNRLLKPEEIIDMPITKPFVTNSDKIIACAEIDPIHRELGYNENLKNDKICVTFKAGGIDIGMTEPVELYRSGQKVKFVEPNKNHTVQFSVRHFLGDESLGLDPVKNPKVKINMVVMDANNRLLLEQTVQTDQILRSDGVIKMPMSRNFSTETGMVRACATVDPIHNELGYNENPLNDTICANFMMVKNYAVRDLKAYPPSVHFGKNERTIEQDVTLTFTVINESSDELGGKLPSSPIVVIKHGNKVVWRNSVSISPGQSRKMSVTIPKRILRQGDNHFSVEVNPDRTILEFKPGVSDPYKDNKATTSIKGVEYAKCQKCMTDEQRTRNDWREKWEWYEQRGNVRESTYSKCFEYETRTRRRCSRDEDGKRECETYEYEVCVDRRDIPYEYCEVTYRREWEEIHDYFETYQIRDVLFRSKYTKDMAKKNGRGGDGWVSVKNGGYGMIKAGYGFELQIKTHYNTNRYRAPSPEPYSSNWYNGDVYGRYPSGYCDFRTRYPGVTPVEQPRHIYMEMPYVDRSGENVCYILDSTVSGPWYNEVRTFRLPLRSAFGGPSERKIYVNEKAKPNIDNPRKYRIDIVTPRPDKEGDRFYGYYPENQVGDGKKSPSQLTSYLHDCTHFYLVIMPQDDIKTHIIQ